MTAAAWTALGLDLPVPVAYAATWVVDACGDLGAPWAWSLLRLAPVEVPCPPCLAGEVIAAIAAYYGGDWC